MLGLTNLSDARIKVDEKKGDYYYTKTEKKGLNSDQIVSEVLVSVMNNFPWPKSMKSGSVCFSLGKAPKRYHLPD